MKKQKIIAVIGYCEDGESANIFFSKPIKEECDFYPSQKDSMRQIIESDERISWYRIDPKFIHLKKYPRYSWSDICTLVATSVADQIGARIEFSVVFPPCCKK